MDLGLGGKVALVTGASQGIGKAIAAELVREGARVAISSRSAERIEAAAAEIGATGLVHDSEDLDGTPRFVAAAQEALGGGLDVVVTNTGGPPAGPDPLALRARRVGGRLPDARARPARARRGGHAGHARARLGPGGERGLDLGARAAPPPHALEHPPGRARRRLQDDRPRRRRRRRDAQHGAPRSDRHRPPVRASTAGARTPTPARARASRPARVGTPAEMAAAAVFLCSARASYITGEAVRVDGGLTRSV